MKLIVYSLLAESNLFDKVLSHEAFKQIQNRRPLGRKFTSGLMSLCVQSSDRFYTALDPPRI